MVNSFERRKAEYQAFVEKQGWRPSRPHLGKTLVDELELSIAVSLWWTRYDMGEMSENPLRVPDSEVIERLNAAKYVDLRQISEPNKNVFNSLRIVVGEAVVNEAAVVASDRPELAQLLAGAHPIESVEGCKLFQLSWKHYLAYLVTEELVGSNAPNGYDDEVYTGKILRVYTRSHFLDHVMRDTGGHIQEILHYKLICLNHLIDVVSYYRPDVQLLAGEKEFGMGETWVQ